MQQPMNGNPVQVVVLAQPMVIDKQIRYRNMRTGLARQLIGLGVAQLIIGVLCFIFQAIGLWICLTSRVFSLDFVGHGFWTGIFFIIAGPFGIVGGVKRSRCNVIAFNVLSILSASFALCLIGIAIPGAILYAAPNCQYVYYNYGTTNRYGYYDQDYKYVCNGIRSTTGVAMESLLAILGLIEGIIAIWSAAICCGIGACCCDCGSSSPNQNQFLMTDQQFSGQQQVFIANQQQAGSNLQPHMFVPNQQQAFVPYPQHQMINIDPRQQMAKYNAQLPNLPPYYGQESNGYTALSKAARDQESDGDIYTGMRNTMVAPEQTEIRGGAGLVYDNNYRE